MRPTTPTLAAGFLVEPPVSEPIAANTDPVATATALPPELPPLINQSSSNLDCIVPNSLFVLYFNLKLRPLLHGLIVGLKIESTHPEPIANSSIFVLPIKTAPFLLTSLLTTVASYGGM